jgi:hypothetical protein
MRKISNFCGIFATLFVTTTIILLASCSQDDDNYDSDMYTLAEMGTRLGGKGDPGSGEGYNIPVYVTYFYLNKTDVVDYITSQLQVKHTVSCPINIWACLIPAADPEILITDRRKISFAEIKEGKTVQAEDSMVVVRYWVKYTEWRQHIGWVNDSAYCIDRVPLKSVTQLSTDPVIQPED